MREKTLMVSVSGIRGIVGHGLDPEVMGRFVGAYGTWLAEQSAPDRPTVVIGRDGRVTGAMYARLTASLLQSVGCDVIDVGLATTPTVEMAVTGFGAQGGIILSASHNPAEWNALKLLNEKGEFLSPEAGRALVARTEAGHISYASFDRCGSYREETYLSAHIESILTLPLIDRQAIAARKFKVVVDGINSVGAIAVPALLQALGVNDVVVLNEAPMGVFAHVAEPLPAHLGETMGAVVAAGADLGVVVDPDADRLALICEDGSYFGEELTQVLAAEVVWKQQSGPFATNLSSSRAIERVAEQYGETVYRSAVGEINVVNRMKEVGAVIGGEGNGGVILPALHHGRDALVGVALTLHHLATSGEPLSATKASYPELHMVKDKVSIAGLPLEDVFSAIEEAFAGEHFDRTDGLKVDRRDDWVHIRASNTEPILRIYAEAATAKAAGAIADQVKAIVASLA